MPAEASKLFHTNNRSRVSCWRQHSWDCSATATVSGKLNLMLVTLRTSHNLLKFLRSADCMPVTQPDRSYFLSSRVRIALQEEDINGKIICYQKYCRTHLRLPLSSPSSAWSAANPASAHPWICFCQVMRAQSPLGCTSCLQETCSCALSLKWLILLTFWKLNFSLRIK